MHTWTQVIVPPWTSSWCQVSPEHPWVADALLGSGEVLASGCAEQPLRAWGCPIWACGFLATVGTAALLAGGEGGHLCALCMKAAFALGGMLLRLPQQHCPVQSHKCFLPHMLSRILRKQWRGNNKRHWLVSRLRRYSELAQISKAGVIHSAHHSNTVMFEIQGGKSWPCYIHGSFLLWDQCSFHLLCLVFGGRVFPQHLKPIFLKQESRVLFVCLTMHGKINCDFYSRDQYWDGFFLVFCSSYSWCKLLGDACQRELEHLGKTLKISPLLSPAAVSHWLEEPLPVGKVAVAKPLWCPETIWMAAPTASLSPDGCGSLPFCVGHKFTLAVSGHAGEIFQLWLSLAHAARICFSLLMEGHFLLDVYK